MTPLSLRAPLPERDALMISPLVLAHVGDSVHDLYVRVGAALDGGKARAMHRQAVGNVNAGAQARALSRVAHLLTETEGDVVRRGRNAHARHAAPKRADPADYAMATGLEALLGFLYLTGRAERLLTILAAMAEPAEETNGRV